MNDADRALRQQEAEHGRNAKASLEELNARFVVMQENLHDAWENTTASMQQERESMWLQLNALIQLRDSFLSEIETGKLAETQLNLLR